MTRKLRFSNRCESDTSSNSIDSTSDCDFEPNNEEECTDTSSYTSDVDCRIEHLISLVEETSKNTKQIEIRLQAMSKRYERFEKIAVIFCALSIIMLVLFLH